MRELGRRRLGGLLVVGERVVAEQRALDRRREVERGERGDDVGGVPVQGPRRGAGRAPDLLGEVGRLAGRAGVAGLGAEPDSDHERRADRPAGGHPGDLLGLARAAEQARPGRAARRRGRRGRTSGRPRRGRRRRSRVARRRPPRPRRPARRRPDRRRGDRGRGCCSRGVSSCAGRCRSHARTGAAPVPCRGCPRPCPTRVVALCTTTTSPSGPRSRRSAAGRCPSSTRARWPSTPPPARPSACSTSATWARSASAAPAPRRSSTAA